MPKITMPPTSCHTHGELLSPVFGISFNPSFRNIVNRDKLDTLNVAFPFAPSQYRLPALQLTTTQVSHPYQYHTKYATSDQSCWSGYSHSSYFYVYLVYKSAQNPCYTTENVVNQTAVQPPRCLRISTLETSLFYRFLLVVSDSFPCRTVL